MPPHPDQARWFTEEVLPHDLKLKAYLRGAFPAVRDVEDVVQESYLRLWRFRAAQPVRSAKAFLFHVARNLARDWHRRERASPFVPMGSCGDSSVFIDERPDAAELLTREEKGRLLGRALAELPERCREIVFLHKIKGLPQREVAARLGVTEKNVADQIATGVARCEAYYC